MMKSLVNTIWLAPRRREDTSGNSAPAAYDTRRADSLLEHRDRADGRAGAAAPLERQADEAEFALADQRLQIAQALNMRDVELEAGLVHERVDVSHRARAHGVDAEMDDALTRKPLGRRDVDAGVVGRIGRRGKGARVMPGAQEHRAALGNGGA